MTPPSPMPLHSEFAFALLHAPARTCSSRAISQRPHLLLCMQAASAGGLRRARRSAALPWRDLPADGGGGLAAVRPRIWGRCAAGHWAVHDHTRVLDIRLPETGRGQSHGGHAQKRGRRLRPDQHEVGALRLPWACAQLLAYMCSIICNSILSSRQERSCHSYQLLPMLMQRPGIFELCF